MRLTHDIESTAPAHAENNARRMSTRSRAKVDEPTSVADTPISSTATDMTVDQVAPTASVAPAVLPGPAPTPVTPDPFVPGAPVTQAAPNLSVDSEAPIPNEASTTASASVGPVVIHCK